MEISFTKEAENEFRYWQKKDIKIQNKIITLIKNIQTTPYDGLGKPEALKHELSGTWSRRINDKHRLVYKVLETEKVIIILSCKGHYYSN